MWYITGTYQGFCNTGLHTQRQTHKHTQMFTYFVYVIGLDCSVQSSFIQWNDYTGDNTDWGSGGHSNVYWNNSLWLFGGYVFPSPASSIVDDQATSIAAALWRCVCVESSVGSHFDSIHNKSFSCTVLIRVLPIKYLKPLWCYLIYICCDNTYV